MPYYRSGYNRYARRWPYRSWRSSSVTRSQQSGRRYFNVSFPVESLVTATIGSNQSFSNVIRTCPLFCPVGTNATDANLAIYAASLVGSLAYRSYTRLYDSVKINSVSLTVSLAATIGEGGIPGIRVYSSWDRDLQWGEGAITSEKLINGPESQVVTFINNSRCKFYRSNQASDLQERTTFHDCTVKLTENTAWYDEQWGAATNKSVGYHPSCSIVLQASNTVGSVRTVPVQIQARYNVTFRNPKFGLSVDGASRFGDQKADLFEAVASGSSDSDVKGEVGVSEGSVLSKKVKIEEPVYEESVVPDEDDGMRDESSQPQLTKEELLEMLKKYEEKKN